MALTFANSVVAADGLPVSGLASVEAAKARAGGSATTVEMVRKADTEQIAAASQYLPEDEFKNLYVAGGDAGGTNNIFLSPPANPKTLKQLPHLNNILLQCIEAMEVNIDGTGHEFVPLDDKTKASEEEIARAKAFFDEPMPGENFISIRRKLRTELEAVGWAALEVLRNLENEVVGIRNILGHTIRVCRAEDPVTVTKTINRNGKPVTLQYLARERKFGQILTQSAKRYYREFGASRELNRESGEWETPSKPVPPALRASELLFFTVSADVDTPYGVPRWFNEMPSVVGSRKAEEANLDFLDAGTMPPVAIFIGGGQASKDTAAALRTYLSGQTKNRQRAVVVDVVPNTGSLDTAAKTEIKVERFGSESVKDSMFGNYDKSTEEHVRTGFRLPPLFIGKAADYSFASASTSYMVAEAQVFKPERDSFDARINSTIMRALECKTIRFQSKPVTLKDAALMLQGLTEAKDVSEGNNWVTEVNKVTGLALQFDAKKAKETSDMAKAQSEANIAATHAKAAVPPGAKKLAFSPAKVKKTAEAFLAAEGLVPNHPEVDPSEVELIRKSVDELGDVERDLFNRLVANYVVTLAK